MGLRFRFEPVPGKPNCFRAIDKATGKPYNVAEGLLDNYFSNPKRKRV